MNILGPMIICFSIIALIVFAIYYLIYKNKINKRLQSHESTAHISMVSGESAGKIMFAVVTIVFFISIVCMLAKISSNIDSYYNYLREEILYLRHDVSKLESQIDEQNSLFTMFECNFGKVDNVNHTVEAIFKCIPKTSGNDTSISVTIGNNSTTLEKNNEGIYTGKATLPMFDHIDDIIYASITTNDITTGASISNEIYTPLYTNCLPDLYGDMEEDNFEFKNNKFYINGNYYNQKDDDIKDIKLIFKINGKTEKEIAITEDLTNISEEFPAQIGNKVEIIAQGTDNYGYIHQILILGTTDNNSWSEASIDTISDSKGNILYNGENSTIRVETRTTIE